MPFPTQQVFVHSGDWDDNSRSHPAINWLEHYSTKVIDGQRWDTPYSDWHTEDFVLHKADNTSIAGGAAAWAESKNIFSVFTEYIHVPKFLLCSETQDGFSMLGQATLYMNFQGEPTNGETKIIDTRHGKHWDAVLPGGFHFMFKKVDDAPNGLGFLLSKVELMMDNAPVLFSLLKRGVVKPQDVGL